MDDATKLAKIDAAMSLLSEVRRSEVATTFGLGAELALAIDAAARAHRKIERRERA